MELEEQSREGPNHSSSYKYKEREFLPTADSQDRFRKESQEVKTAT